MRTIFHRETGVWEHVHWRQVFDQEKQVWDELHVSCSLPPPPISRPPADPVAGKAMRLRFYWETGQWEHEWENGSSLQLPPGPLVDFVYAGPLPPPPPSSRPPPHAIHGEVQKVHFSYDEPQSCVFEYEDGTRLPVPTLPRPSYDFQAPLSPTVNPCLTSRFTVTLEARHTTKIKVGTVGTYHRQSIFVNPSSRLHLHTSLQLSCFITLDVCLHLLAVPSIGGVEWSGASLHGVHGVVAKGVPIWCQFQRCIDREKHAIHSI
jgi:hypothetical protein